MMIRISVFIGLGIEIWKIQKVVNVKVCATMILVRIIYLHICNRVINSENFTKYSLLGELIGLYEK